MKLTLLISLLHFVEGDSLLEADMGEEVQGSRLVLKVFPFRWMNMETYTFLLFGNQCICILSSICRPPLSIPIFNVEAL